MRRDPLFYRLFAQSPALLFDLIDQRPNNAANYRFDAVGVKEPKFEIDGVFLPPESDPPGTVFFAEVQIQKDETLYERLFSESSLYFYRISKAAIEQQMLHCETHPKAERID
jgi:predicted transposase YdaD